MMIRFLGPDVDNFSWINIHFHKKTCIYLTWSFQNSYLYYFQHSHFDRLTTIAGRTPSTFNISLYVKEINSKRYKILDNFTVPHCLYSISRETCHQHTHFKGVLDKIVQRIWPWWVLKYFLADQTHAKINDL